MAVNMAIWVLLGLVVPCLSLCSFTKNCPGGVCTPPHMFSPYVEPFMTEFTSPLMCPEFAGQPLCCSDDQNTELVTKFTLIDFTFGGGADGCDACGVNLKRLWCYFTCSPDQALFAQGAPQQMVLDPMSSAPSWMLVMPANFTVTEKYASNLYNSCKKCPYVRQVPAMQSSQGFLQFQGANSVEMDQMIITFYFEKSPPALELATVPCSNQAPEAYGYPTKPCSCNK